VGKIDTRQPQPVAEPESASADRQSVLIVAVGRQRVGKTTLLNVLTEIYRARGAALRIWNADLHNRTHTLSLFHKDALEPLPGASVVEQRSWIEDRVREQVAQRFDAVLDVGGGITALNTLVDEVRLVEMLERRGIRVVLMYVLGNERADLDYLERFAADRAFMPKSTIVVFNAGLLTNGLSSTTAFDKLMQHPVVLKAIETGAEVTQMPALGCMAAVTDRGLSFADFAGGKQVDGCPETSFFDQERVWLWLHRHMPAFFSRLPQEWLPAIKQPLLQQS
jgi:hypothetical protein